MELKTTRYDVDGATATLTLSRPHRRNAWTGRMHTEFRWLMESAEADPTVRVVIITGEGSDFCVGADPQALEERDGPRRGGQQAVDPPHRVAGAQVDLPGVLRCLVGGQPVGEGRAQAARAGVRLDGLTGVAVPMPHLAPGAHQPIIVQGHDDRDPGRLQDLHGPYREPGQVVHVRHVEAAPVRRCLFEEGLQAGLHQLADIQVA